MRAKAVIVYDGELKLKFSSLAEAAKYYGFPYISMYHSLVRGSGRYKNLSLEFASPEDSTTLTSTTGARETGSLEVTIDGKTYYSVSAPNKTNCVDCDIFKAHKPVSMIDAPLCYSNTLNNHKIVDYCRSRRIIWQKARKGNV